MTAITTSPARKSIPRSGRPLPKSKRIGLRSKPDGQTAWDRLPFVGKDHGKYLSCWDLPVTGGYFGGLGAGKVVARLYLKYARDERDNPTGLASTLLSSMFASLAAKEASTKDEEDALAGQRTGFLNELSYWLGAAAHQLGSSFDAIPERSLVEQANEHLLRDDAAYIASISQGDSQ